MMRDLPSEIRIDVAGDLVVRRQPPRAGIFAMMRTPKPRLRGWSANTVDLSQAGTCFGVVHCSMIGAGNHAKRAFMMRGCK